MPRASRAASSMTQALHLLGPARAREEACEERERRQQREHDRSERGPGVSADGLAPIQNEQAQDDRGDTDARKDEREVELAKAGALAQHAREQRRSRDEVERPEREEGDRVQVGGLLLRCHRAPQMIGGAAGAPRRTAQL
jgi:hypothetical protein